MQDLFEAPNVNAGAVLLAKINTEKKLYTFIQRVAANKKIADALPQTHRFFRSLHDFHSVRGTLTDKQKMEANRNIRKYAEQFAELMTYSTSASSDKNDEQIEREAIQGEVRAMPEDAPLPQE